MSYNVGAITDVAEAINNLAYKVDTVNSSNNNIANSIDNLADSINNAATYIGLAMIYSASIQGKDNIDVLEIINNLHVRYSLDKLGK